MNVDGCDLNGRRAYTERKQAQLFGFAPIFRIEDNLDRSTVGETVIHYDRGLKIEPIGSTDMEERLAHRSR
jgi:hypothetical protein